MDSVAASQLNIQLQGIKAEQKKQTEALQAIAAALEKIADAAQRR